MDYTVEDILIPAHHPCFEGHFPGHPVFPAVAQIDLVLDILQQRMNQSVTLVAIRKAKFPAPIGPDCIVQVSLKVDDVTVFWQIFGKDKTYSMGTLGVSFDPA
ncbi:MAG: hypothetical protein M3Q07_18210 [Pseudobdellovibrionaceae bacterium]|nr:hypothetical protein [Pseudobdellovibrionaceae bacterium]